MNCKNCNCPACVNDRNRTDLKARRLLTIGSWSWNRNPREAAKILLTEVAAGRNQTTPMNATLPTYKNTKGNVYACGKSEQDGKARAYQIKDGKLTGPVRVLDFSELDLVGTVTLNNWKVTGETRF